MQMKYTTPYEIQILEDLKLTSALRDRRIYFSGEVDRNIIFKTCYLLDRLREIDKQEGTKPDIEIMIDSYGGYIYHGLQLISKIEQMVEEGYNIIGTTTTVGMSMGFMIPLACSTRRAYRYARLMFHQPSSGAWGALETQERSVEETRQLWMKMKELVIKSTNITEEQMEECKKSVEDWYMWPEEALELGVIDEIL